MKSKCSMIDCSDLKAYTVRVKIQHPSRKTWQSWRVCHAHMLLLKRDKDHWSDRRFTWQACYWRKGGGRYWRDVIEIGEITEYIIPML